MIVRVSLYTRTILRIHEINCSKILEPHEVLATLLEEFIKEKKKKSNRHLSQANAFLIFNDTERRRSDVQEAGKVLNLLRTSKRSDPTEVIVEGLNYLNKKREIDTSNDLWNLFSAFFSIYAQYQHSLFDSLYKKMQVGDEWGTVVRRKCSTFVVNKKHLRRESYQNAVLASSRVIHLSPELKEDIVKYLLGRVKKRHSWAISCLVKLQELVPDDMRDNVVDALILGLNTHNFPGALNALIALKAWMNMGHEAALFDFVTKTFNRITEAHEFVNKGEKQEDNELATKIDFLIMSHEKLNQLISLKNVQLNGAYYFFLIIKLSEYTKNPPPYRMKIALLASLTFFNERMNEKECENALDLISPHFNENENRHQSLQIAFHFTSNLTQCKRECLIKELDRVQEELSKQFTKPTVSANGGLQGVVVQFYAASQYADLRCLILHGKALLMDGSSSQFEDLIKITLTKFKTQKSPGLLEKKFIFDVLKELMKFMDVTQLKLFANIICRLISGVDIKDDRQVESALMMMPTLAVLMCRLQTLVDRSLANKLFQIIFSCGSDISCSANQYFRDINNFLVDDHHWENFCSRLILKLQTKGRAYYYSHSHLLCAENIKQFSVDSRHQLINVLIDKLDFNYWDDFVVMQRLLPVMTQNQKIIVMSRLLGLLTKESEDSVLSLTAQAAFLTVHSDYCSANMLTLVSAVIDSKYKNMVSNPDSNLPNELPAEITERIARLR